MPCTATSVPASFEYARWHKSITAHTRLMLHPFAVARLEVEAELKKWERELDTAEAEMTKALRSNQIGAHTRVAAPATRVSWRMGLPRSTSSW